jgi:4-carboxymuconolactone decarboxylase
MTRTVGFIGLGQMGSRMAARLPGLKRKTRSLLCVAMMIALNRQHELRIHVGTALNNGATADEIREVLLQSIIYCGLPAGLEGFRVAEEVLSARNML